MSLGWSEIGYVDDVPRNSTGKLRKTRLLSRS